MATLLDAPKAPDTAKIEEFVEKQIDAARRRIRSLDKWIVGLIDVSVFLVFLLAAQFIDRQVETPRGTGWAAVAVFAFLEFLVIYLFLYRPTRRQINPYFAARQVEQTVPNSKNSLVTWVDFDEDKQLPGSIRTAIGQKAARDLKGVDLNRAIENRRIVWLAIMVAVLALVNLVVAFLPPTRTELRLQEPKDGDVTVFNNQDVSFRVHVNGRVPGANDADAVRLRLWYNPDDPETYEERPMTKVEGERREFALVVPAKQVRFGFHYKILAGNSQTPEYTVTCKIIPEFTGFEVSYEYPDYLKRAPETTNDPNLLAPFGSTATLIVSTNREVKRGHVEIEGQPRTLDGELIEGRPDAIQFTVPIEKEGIYRIWFTTPEGDKNQDPARLRLGVIDPKPVFRTFDLDYDYPAYLRFKPMSVKDVRESEIEAPRGTKIVLTAKTSRGVKNAKFELNGQSIAGEPVPEQPMWVRFKLPALDMDGTAKVTFTPTTDEGPSAPRSVPVRVLIDQAPEVQITEPAEDEKQLPANGTLELKGLATDDHGVDKLILLMRVIGAEDLDLKPKPYRRGMSFRREQDNSWPTRVEYKDFIKLPELRMDKNPNWRVAAGAKIEYWLEAFDNCAVPKPNRNISKRKWIIVTAPATKPDEQKEIEQQNQKDKRDQQTHEKRQDQQNATEKRDVQQQPPKGAEQGDKKDGQPDRQNGATDNPAENMNPPMGTPPDQQPGGAANHDEQTKDVEKAINKTEQDKNPSAAKPDTRPVPDAKVDPGDSRPEPKTGPMAGPPPAEERKPKSDPNKDMTGDGTAGATKAGNIDKSKDDKSEAKPGGEGKSDTPNKSDAKPSFGGGSSDAGKNKPEPKDSTKPGVESKEPVAKADAHDMPKSDPKNAGAKDKREPSTAKPEKQLAQADTKKPSSDPGAKGDVPPSNAADTKPERSPDPAGMKPQPKKEDVANAGGSRGAPKNPDDAGGDKRSNPMGPMDQQARSDTKSGPRDARDQSQNSEQGQLDRELGELDREINSTKPKIDDRRKTDLQRLVRNQENREQVRKKLDELEKQADEKNDELKKKKVQECASRCGSGGEELRQRTSDAGEPGKDRQESRLQGRARSQGRRAADPGLGQGRPSSRRDEEKQRRTQEEESRCGREDRRRDEEIGASPQSIRQERLAEG